MELYTTVKKNFLIEIETFSRKHSLSLFDKIRKEKDKRNLESLLTEAHFGLFLDKIGTSIKYNNVLGDSLTPDFSFVSAGQQIIVEVARINPVQKDMDIDDEETELIDRFRKENPGVPFMPQSHSITWKPDKLVGQSGAIAAKATKYKKVIDQQNKPFIICVYSTFISGLDRMDLTHGLYGSVTSLSGEYEGLGYAFNSPFRILDGALFYNNETVRETVSGILLKDHDGSFLFFRNFSSSNRLSKENLNLFNTIEAATDM